jgi:glyoxylase-like metal-dependent hydrolase (beta-lactamase superfamily II)/rhodanese-related sulfurtransferase
MNVEQLYTGCLAEAAYYIESEGEAIIIDPLRETAPYLEKLKQTGARLKYIFETHFHADFVSGHLDLAAKTGATIVFGPQASTEYDSYQAADGEEIQLGKLTFQVLHTPGHTLESTTYLLRDESGKDYAIFTGDTLFLGDVGRPDLAIKRGSITKADLAGMLFDSLRSKIMPLADEVIVYPAHGAGSACGKNLSKETWGYLGDQKQTNYALRADMSKAEFVAEVTAGLLPPPQYFAKNALLNKTGYQSFDEVLERGAIGLSPEAFEAKASYSDALVLDTRKAPAFAAGHIPGSIFIGLDGSFAPWVGALITDLKQALLLIVEEGREQEAVTRLARVGYDHTLGFLAGGIEAWQAAGKDIAQVESIPAEEFANRSNKQHLQVLDVRKPTEFLSQHLAGAENLPLDYLNQNMNRLDPGSTYYVHCLGGYRSMIFASILKSRGIHQVVDIQKGWRAIEATDLALSEYVCPTELPQATIDQAVAEVA